jgi:isoleucyl-tRNA synthetase
MNNSFIESVWWSLKNIWDKKLIYEGVRVLPYCPRCETPISNSEIAMDNSYKDITDISVYVKLAVENEPRTYLIVWTTTPWTLPGNTAAAVNPDLDYVIVKVGGENGEYYIVAKEKTGIFKDGFELVEEMKGSALVGKKYTPPFDYFLNKDLPNKENAWKVYAAPYVTAEAGSGIVHLAPAYGEEDMVLAKEHNIPFVRHVGTDGKFTADVTDFAGIKVKPKEDHQSGDVAIIKALAAHGTLFAKEKIVHSYPHCHRCETPLYYFALPSWFIKISDVKKDLIRLNEDISWSPEHLKHGRFGKSVEGAPDWNISRNRFWASPLPFWRCEKCDKTECIGSVADIAARMPAKNEYYVMRHGEAEFNLTDMISYSPNDNNSLTTKGKSEVAATAAKLKADGIHVDAIYASDLVRGRETAEIMARELGVQAAQVFLAPEIRELNAGPYGGKTWEAYRNTFASVEARFDSAQVPEGGESLLDVRDRAVKFVQDLEKKHTGKKILIVSHGDTIFFMQKGVKGLSKKELVQAFISKPGMIPTGVCEKLDYSPLPLNKNFELDLHRPYVDDMVFVCSCKGAMKRIPEVIDCWFESGSMPFAQSHYPFEQKEKFEKNFPADFVSEYIAQTRTWFYYMHAISTMLFEKAPFKHVLTTGTVLAEDGEKMSKSKGNFPDPALIFNKYGVDALRFYLLGSPLLKSEDLNFSERGVDEVYKKIILRLKNVVSFYQMYAANDPAAAGTIATQVTAPESKNILDRWIVERINIVVAEVTTAMEQYRLDHALSQIDGFIEDLSVWYLRRSRDRFKDENPAVRTEALRVFRAVLFKMSKTMAPFMPFIAEEIYRTVNGEKESVHLEEWPMAWVTPVEDMVLISDMLETRRVVSLALEARAKAGIKVRQPLRKLVVKSSVLNDKPEHVAVIADETNIKEIAFDAELADEVALDTEITAELREEGNLRELVRFVQELRKKTGLTPGELAVLEYEADSDGKEFITRFEAEIKKAALLSAITLTKVDNKDGKIEIDNAKFEFKVSK